MYSVRYLPIARQDFVDIVRYISIVLQNPAAAERLTEQLIDAVEGLSHFPYANPVYIPIKPLKREYRKLSVKNYLVFYSVDEARHEVTIYRAIYARRNYEKVLL